MVLVLCINPFCLPASLYLKKKSVNMSDDLDYMSDEFITKCLNDKVDVRPGLLKTRKEQREHNLTKKKTIESEKKKKPPGVLQVEVLEEGLKQPISCTNKGFSMLQKMGFKSGMGLGKDNNGIIEPIGISLKNDKQGLGHKKPVKKFDSKNANVKSKLDSINEDDYRAFLSKRNRERDMVSDLRKSQRICNELDVKVGKSEPEEKWFWPDEPDSLEDVNCEKEEKIVKDDEESEYDNEEKLQILTKYLRQEYHYCIWCKVQYNDEKDMEECPGVTREEH